MPFEFEPNPGFADELLRGAEVRLGLERELDRAVEAAKDLAPDDPATKDRGMVVGIVGEVDLTRHGWRGRVTQRDFRGHFFEWGTVHHAPQPHVGPGVESVFGALGPARDDDEGGLL